MKVLAKDITTGARKKAIIPLTANPGVKAAANQKQNPFTTRENAPNVNKLIGKESVEITGLIAPFTKPITKPAIIAVGKLARFTPGTTMSTISKLNAVANVVKNMLNIIST
jgi:hypothetical protein